MNKDFTALMLIVDSSGSMATIWEQTEKAVNGLLEEQKKFPGKLSIKMIEFNHDVKSKKLIDSKEFDKWKLSPHGLTALHDAIGIGIDELGQELAGLTEEERPASVIVAIMTDGFENSSKEYTASRVKEMIDHQRKNYNWDFIFLGANQDAISTAQDYGIGHESALTFGANSKGVANTMAATSRYVTGTRSGLVESFSDEDRDKSMG